VRGGVSRTDVAENGKGQSDGQFARCHDVGLRRVDHDDAFLRAGRNIDVVCAVARPSDNFELRGLREQAAVDLRDAADDERVICIDCLLNFCLAQAKLLVDRKPLPTQVGDRIRGYFFRNQDSHAPIPPLYLALRL